MLLVDPSSPIRNRGGCSAPPIRGSRNQGVFGSAGGATRPFRSDVRPRRRPAQRSACRTQFRSVSDEHPIFDAIEQIAAHCDSYCSECSNTIRMTRPRTSGEYLLGLAMTPSSQGIRSPAIPGRFIFRLEWGFIGVSVDRIRGSGRVPASFLGRPESATHLQPLDSPANRAHRGGRRCRAAVVILTSAETILSDFEPPGRFRGL
jgi:hypothetical protein